VASNDARTVPERVKDVLGYFLRNPHAADSLEGVARWRVRQEYIHNSVDEISEALDWLVGRGFLLEDSSRVAAPIYRLNVESTVEAARLLAR